MQLELVVTLNLLASHSLEEKELPHTHRWDIQVGLKGDLNQGRVVSLTEAQSLFQELLSPLHGSFLNENSSLDDHSRANPTCENLAFFLMNLFQKNLHRFKKTAVPVLSFVQVGVWEESGQLGFARVSV
jgi:6-pyruvoyl-tetrahydropterin synthase